MVRPGIAAPPGSDAQKLTDVVTRLRRALRTGIRTDYPWESLPMAQVEVLQSLRESGPLRVGEIASILQLAPATASGLVQQLVEAGTAERAQDSTDRRVSLVRITERGRAQMLGWQAAHEERIEAALQALSARQRAVITSALPALEALVVELASPRDR